MQPHLSTPLAPVLTIHSHTRCFIGLRTHTAQATQAQAFTFLVCCLTVDQHPICRTQPEQMMLTREHSRHFAILSVLALALAAGTRQQTEILRTIVDGVDLDMPLATFFLDVQAPLISIQEDRHGLPQNRTRVLVEISRSHVPAHMPVITSSLQPGLVHSVVHTWDWLQVGLSH